MKQQRVSTGGFALPTVLIASVVMLTVLAASVSSVAAVRTSLKVQYYEQLAKAAGEAGVAYAKACLAKNGNIPLWSDSKPLTPSTDCAGNQMLEPAVEVLVVGGGGGGGIDHGGGGGGGGVKQETVPVGVATYAVTVGSGGAGGSGSGTGRTSGGTGGSSSFGTLISVNGGGGGGSRISGAVNSFTAAGSGGSGGGGNGTYSSSTGTGAPGGSGIAGQGNSGGRGSSISVSTYVGNGGGGGGAGAPGGNATGLAAGEGSSGDGGIGQLSDISGQQVYYGGGGSGGRWAAGQIGIPGLTGGGAGTADGTAGAAGQANTGGGGGGGGSGGGPGGAGGSGVVIVRYANNGTVAASGGVMSNVGAYTIHRFTSNGSLYVSRADTSTCPSDPRCSVLVNDQLRSSFSVARPALDADGRAATIPNNGFVELLRASNGEVWRTYRQPSVQAAVVPDLCSGAATSALGWSNAVLSSKPLNIPNAAAARPISMSSSDLIAGSTYYQKGFAVTEAGSYNLSVVTDLPANQAKASVDGGTALTATGSLANRTIYLSAGCHTVTVELINKVLTTGPAYFAAAVSKAGGESIVATDSTWRTTSGATVGYMDPRFYADSSIWVAATDAGAISSAYSIWSTSVAGDTTTRRISAGCASSCPIGSSTYFRDGSTFTISAAQDYNGDGLVDVMVASFCDDNCWVYLNGEKVIADSPLLSGTQVTQQLVSLAPGTYRLAAQLYNAGTVLNFGALSVAVVNQELNSSAYNTVYRRTDTSWRTSSNIWIPGALSDANTPSSYETNFTP